MTNFNLGRWLLVALAIVGLALAPGLGGAHGTDTTADDAPPYDGTDDWATWMDDHMTDHMGPGAVEWMEDTTGVTVDETAQDHAADYHTADGHAADYHTADNHTEDDHADDAAGSHTADDRVGGSYRQGHC